MRNSKSVRLSPFAGLPRCVLAFFSLFVAQFVSSRRFSSSIDLFEKFSGLSTPSVLDGGEICGPLTVCECTYPFPVSLRSSGGSGSESSKLCRRKFDCCLLFFMTGPSTTYSAAPLDAPLWGAQ
ncbi:hypothetical protein DMENIID0001_137020 [Sergentomyia squamirostris]